MCRRLRQRLAALHHAPAPEADESVDAGKIGLIEREDGDQQVTYAGWPLYYFQGDKQASDALGHNVKHLGASWHLVSPAGERITQGERSGVSPMEVAPSRGEEPASRGQEVHDRTEDVEGADYDA
ncbi:COG4315 family predicted lipoprotein [Modicisalibacter luteus]|uniref:COG4315 family predicted lipoprotein n=1 Tax=Modicisalibacter luteus TaxID=453962 RepID=UPI0036414C45